MVKKIALLLSSIVLLLLLITCVYAYIYAQKTQTIIQTITPMATEAFIAYRDTTTTLNTAKARLWLNDTAGWDAQTELPSAGSPVRSVKVAYSPLQERSGEKIVVTLSDDGYLDAFVWNSSNWHTTNNIGYVGTVANAYRPFNVAYERTSGDILLVYGVNNPNPHRDFAYKVWNITTGWGPEEHVDDPDHISEIQNYWVELASNPLLGSDEITLVLLGDDSDSDCYVWDGSSWGYSFEFDPLVVLSGECVAVAYEQLSGIAWVAVGSSSTPNTIAFACQTNGIWNQTHTHISIGAVPKWITLKADPASNKLMLTSVDNSSRLNILYWSGGGSWILNAGTPSFIPDTAVDTSAQRCADFAWEPSGSKGLIVWGTTSGYIKYQSFDGEGWGTVAEVSMGSHVHLWVQLRTCPKVFDSDVKILGAVMEGTVFCIGSVVWDGSTFSVLGANNVSAGVGVGSYECFDLKFKNHFVFV
jgi:hypothetical protein